VHIKENPAGFHRLDVVWTPTTLVLDETGKERHRIEGYLPKDEFAAQLTLGLARVAFMHKKWADAEKLYDEILQKYPTSAAAPEAVYWKAVCHYKATNDHTVLGEVPKTLQQKYPNSVWVKKAIPWAA
jgi:outer membrane protein assembly factor BamD (BamD/ComL family)